MDRLHAIRVFTEVARQGSFSAASRSLNISAPSVSRLVSDLENDLGVRLFNRSTRAVALTEDGERFLDRSVPLVDELDLLAEEIRERQHRPMGRLRISSVIAFGQEVISPALTQFMEQNPGIEVELDLTNRKVDLVEEHFDLAIRIGGTDGLEESSLKARKIYSQKLTFVATPDYVRAAGTPESLDELSDHRVVKQISGNWGRVNHLRHAGSVVVFTLPERFVVNSPNAARNAVLTGNAIGLLADYLTADLLSDGRLVRVLPQYETLEQPVYAVFVHRNYMPAKVRTFIDFLGEIL